MKTKILYLMLSALITGTISITSCSSSKKADTIRRDSINNSNQVEGVPDTAKKDVFKKDTV